MLPSIWQDIRHGTRIAARQRVGTLALLVSVAIAIGTATTVYTWTRAIAIDALPGVADEDVVDVATIHPTGGVAGISYQEYRAYRDASSLAGIVAFDDIALATGADGLADRRWGMLVTADYFEVLGVRPLLGRFFSRAQETSDERVVVISHRLWQERFGAQSPIGENLVLNRQSFAIIGVAPPDFAGTAPRQRMDLWVPLHLRQVLVPGPDQLAKPEPWLSAVARLRPGATADQATAELGRIGDELRHTVQLQDGRRPVIYPLWSSPRHGGRVLVPLLAVVWAVAALVLLIACSNIAGVLVARAASRRREMAIRLTLGASRFRLLRQLLTESVLIAAAGGLVGLPLAYMGAQLLAAFIPPTSSPIALSGSLHSGAVIFGLGLSAATGVIFGITPALTTTSVALNHTLQAEAGSVVAGTSRLRSSLLVGQVALSALLLVVGAALGRSVVAARSIDPGFEPRGVLVATVDMAAGGYDEARGQAALARVVERVGQVPGVRAASLVRRVPLGLGGRSTNHGFRVEGHTPAPHEDVWAHTNEVGPRYFAVMGIPVLAGRDFEARDDARAPPVAIVNQAMAERYWGRASPIGGRIAMGDRKITVVGVVADADLIQLGEPPAPSMFFPVLQKYRADVSLLVRADRDPLGLARSLRRAVAEVDGGLPVFAVRTLEQHIASAQFPQRLIGSLAGGLGLFALVLAALGVYAVTAQTVAHRRREMGIRMALGETPASVFRRVLGRAAILVAIGLALGVGVSPLLQKVLAPLLIGVGVADPVSLLAVAAAVGAVCLVACALPAARAARLEPLAALRDR